MAVDEYRISDLTTVVTINNGDIMELSTIDLSSETGYTSVKMTITQLGDKLNNELQYATDLQTTNKTIIGAINEIFASGSATIMTGTTTPTSSQGEDGNLYVKYTEGTGGASDTVDALYVKLDGEWCQISTGGGSGSGHTILDDSGTSLTQRSELQFKGAYSEDNSTDQITEVNVVRSMTQAQFNQLSSDEKVGLINVTDEPLSEGGGGYYHEYSTTEKVVGKWIDGSTIYEKTLNVGTITSETTFAHGITNLDKIIYYEGFGNYGGNTPSIMPFQNPQGSYSFGINTYDSTNITFARTSNLGSNFSDCYCTIRYTKSNS